MNSFSKNSLPNKAPSHFNAQTSHSSTPDTPPSLQNKYIFRSKLGSGSQGDTWLAESIQTKERVAIKSLNIAKADSIDHMDEMIRLIRRESDVLRNIKNDHVPRYVETIDFLDRNKPEYFLIQEYIQAPSLETILKEKLAFSEDQVIDIATQLLDVINALHHSTPPVIHRDIKPSNILLDARGHIYLIDFGIAAIQNVGQSGMTMVGTYGYTAPEQFAGQARPESDYYSLAATMVHLLSGKSPDKMDSLSSKTLKETLKGVSANTISVIEKMLNPDVTQRLADAHAIREMLTSGGSESSYTTIKEPSLKKAIAITSAVCFLVVFPILQYMAHGFEMVDVLAYLLVTAAIWLGLVILLWIIFYFRYPIRRLTKHAEKGTTFYQYVLAERYEFGNGVPKDMTKAFQWYLKAAQSLNQKNCSIPQRIKAKQFHKDAKLRVAKCYDNGEGTAMSKAMAATWYRQSADERNHEAQYALGRLYETGAGIEKNIEEAQKLYEKAASSNHPDAQYHLGLIYKEKGDRKKAESWLRKTAMLGHPDAQNVLNKMFG